MSFNIEVRKKQLQSLDQYINASRNRVLSILGHLGWNPKHILEKTDHITCPINSGHKIPVANVDKHVQKCCLKSSGYDLSAEFLSEPNTSQSSIILDNAKKIEILNEVRVGKTSFRAVWNGMEPDPLTSDRLFTSFSSDERLALYDYCVKNSEPPPIPSEFILNIDEKVDDNKNLTPEELLEKERNAKRRRIKYKSVHTGRNKSHTEVIREVINNQMELYQEYIANTSTQVESTNSIGYVSTIDQQNQQSFLDVSYAHDNSSEKNDKTLSDKVSSIDSSYGHYSEKDDYSDRGARERSHKERYRKREDDRERHRPKKRSRDREKHHSRSHHRNGYDRHHELHRRSDRPKRY